MFPRESEIFLVAMDWVLYWVLRRAVVLTIMIINYLSWRSEQNITQVANVARVAKLIVILTFSLCCF